MERDYGADPRVRSFWDEWKACMADAGLNVGSVDQLVSGFTAEANDILTQVEVGPSSGGGVLAILGRAGVDSPATCPLAAHQVATLNRQRRVFRGTQKATDRGSIVTYRQESL